MDTGKNTQQGMVTSAALLHAALFVTAINLKQPIAVFINTGK
jgi:hypothetical protein